MRGLKLRVVGALVGMSLVVVGLPAAAEDATGGEPELTAPDLVQVDRPDVPDLSALGDPAPLSENTGPLTAALPPSDESAPETAVDVARREASASGERVEIVDARSEMTSTFANPDGSLTDEVSSAPVWVRDGDGWRPVDPTLVASKAGGFEPAAVSADVAVAGGGQASRGGSSEVVRTTRPTGDENAQRRGGPAGVSVAWSVPGGLPEPKVGGTTARYVGALAGGADVVVESRATGPELSIVISDAKAAQASYTLGLSVEGATPELDEAGGIVLRDDDGAEVGAVTAPVMFDASVTDGGPRRTAPVVTRLERSEAGYVVTLTPDPKFLADPSVVWPVTIDPATNLSPSLDTYVGSFGPTSNFDSSNSLFVGYTGLGGVSRAFIRFSTTSIANKAVTAASLSLYQNWQNPGTCTATPMWVEGSADLASGRTWNTQPATDGTQWATASTAGDATACASQVGFKTLDVTSLVQSWATSGASNRTLAVRANESSTANQGKGFSSGDAWWNGQAPKLSVTYITPPNTPSALAPASGTVIDALSTTVSATQSGGDAGASLVADFQLLDDTNATIATYQVGGPAGQPQSWTLPADKMRPAFTYTWRVRSCVLYTTVCSAWATATISPNAALAQGSHDYFTYTSFPLSDRAGVRVNVASGNLVVDHTDLVVKGIRTPYRLARTYNSLAPAAGPLGNGWSSAMGGTERLQANPDGSYTYFDPTGSVHLLTATNGGWPLNVPGDLDASIYDAPAYGLRMLQFNHDGDGRSQGDKVAFHRGGAFDNQLLVYSNPDNHHVFMNRVGGSGTNAAEIADVVDSYSRPFDYTYSSGRITAVDDPNGARDVAYHYETDADLADFVDAAGNTTDYAYDANHRLTQIVGPEGNTINVTYDTRGRVATLTQVIGGQNRTTEFDYTDTLDPDGYFQTTVKDANSNVTDYRFDNANRVRVAYDPLGGKQDTKYDNNSNVTEVKDPSSKTWTNSWSTVGNNLESREMPTKAKASFTYNGTNTSNALNGYQPDTSTSPQGRQSSYTFNASGNQMSTTDASTAGSSVEREGTNGVTCSAPTGVVCKAIDPRSKETKFEYWSYGGTPSADVRKILRPVGLGNLHFEYDAVSRVTKVVDGKGQATLYAYDDLDRVTTITYVADSKTINYTYDDNGNVTAMVDRDLSAWAYGYDDANRLTSSTGPGEVVGYTYDPVGNLLTMTDASGTRTYTYTKVNMVETVKNPNGQTTTMTYDTANPTRRTKVAYPNGVEMRITPDDSGRTELIQAVKTTTTPETVLASYDYTFTNTSQSNATNGDTAKRQSVTTLDGTTTYTYGADERLTGATYDPVAAGPNVVRSWNYDPAGNITSATVDATTTSYAFNDANQLTTGGAAYDANGNRTTTTNYGFTALSYDPADHTVSATPNGGTASAMTYAGQSQDHLRSVGSASMTTAASMGITRVVAGTSSWTFTREPDGTLVGLRYGGASYWYLFDGQGSVIGLTDANGNLVNSYRYDPYGKRLAATEAVPNPFQFHAGATFTGGTTYKYGTRWYDTTTGTWTQLDPTGADPGYTYTGGDPANRTDPSGRISWNPLDWGDDETECAVNLASAAFDLIGAAEATAGAAAASVSPVDGPVGEIFFAGVAVANVSLFAIDYSAARENCSFL